MEFMSWRNCWVCSSCWMTEVSSTYMSKSLGELGEVLMALDSISSMKCVLLQTSGSGEHTLITLVSMILSLGGQLHWH